MKYNHDSKKESFLSKILQPLENPTCNITLNEIINLLHNNNLRKRKKESLENSSCTSSRLVAKRNSHSAIEKRKRNIKKRKEWFKKAYNDPTTFLSERSG